MKIKEWSVKAKMEAGTQVIAKVVSASTNEMDLNRAMMMNSMTLANTVQMTWAIVNKNTLMPKGNQKKLKNQKEKKENERKRRKRKQRPKRQVKHKKTLNQIKETKTNL